ncbi:hypothetical protein [Phenylobacterium sp.]|uniref:hypothetical protein n=1 Tax=Phenylobacterium sp. TaxID=1871053 RepID=UPI00121A8339|nr:hypothetical protein [Phenylobacterium sp.]THD64534.1 MAG: hypothetical protein E8A12_08140 [Phenylobacterium sp.]
MSDAAKEQEGEEIAELAARLRERHALGRSDGLTRLFDFLAECAVAGARPKEFEVAAAVFARSSAFDGSQDASVRVAVHRLRRKLDDFYAGPGRDEPVRLTIPKGEYRMVAEPRAAEAAAAAPPKAARSLRAYIVAGIALALLLNLAAWVAFWTTHGGGRTLARAQGAAPWSAILKSGTPTLLVLGDYYIFGEIDEAAGVDRLIRQYSINSASDLDDWLMDNPKAMGRYRDLDLYYLPVGAAFALRSVVPLLSRGAAHSENLRVVMASDLTPEMLKRNNIVYVGYLSGLGVLRNPVFAASRFSVGETYDELVDGPTRHVYRSQEGGPSQGDASRRDYGYVAAFQGPSGNHIVVIAGARDTGLQQAAEAMANADALKALQRTVKTRDNFEALYEVDGIGRSSLGGRMVVAAPRTKVDPWTAQPNLSFPQG